MTVHPLSTKPWPDQASGRHRFAASSRKCGIDLSLVGGESSLALLSPNKLNDLGKTLTEQLNRKIERLKITHGREDEIKKQNLNRQFKFPRSCSKGTLKENSKESSLIIRKCLDLKRMIG